MSVNRQAARSEATRAKLIAAGRSLFAQHGYVAIGTEQIVREAGVTRGALYHQFRDKAALFEAVYTETEAEITRRIAEGALAHATDPLAALRAGARLMLDVCAEPEVERIVLLDGPAVLGWERWREIQVDHGLGVISAVLQAGIDAGVMSNQPVRPLAHVLLGALDEAALYVVRAADRETARAEMLQVVDTLIDALAA